MISMTCLHVAVDLDIRVKGSLYTWHTCTIHIESGTTKSPVQVLPRQSCTTTSAAAVRVCAA